MIMGLSKPTSKIAPVRGRRWVPSLLALLLVGAYLVSGRTLPPLEGWGSDYQVAMAQAARTDRKVLVAFHMNGCAPCVAMERTVLRSERVRNALKAFVPIRVNVDEDRELANRFRVIATPMFAVVDARERLLARCEGFQRAEAFAQFLDRAAALPDLSEPTLGSSPPSAP